MRGTMKDSESDSPPKPTPISVNDVLTAAVRASRGSYRQAEHTPEEKERVQKNLDILRAAFLRDRLNDKNNAPKKP